MKKAGGAVAFSGIQQRSEMPCTHTQQLGDFWNDYGTINYEDSSWQWYCNPGNHNTSGGCDAGGGAPKKRPVQSNETEISV